MIVCPDCWRTWPDDYDARACDCGYLIDNMEVQVKFDHTEIEKRERRDMNLMKQGNWNLSIDRMAQRIDEWAIGCGHHDFAEVTDEELMEVYILARSYHQISRDAERLRKSPQPAFDWPRRPDRATLEVVAKLVLVHTELSELLEAVLYPGRDDHCPNLSSESAEAADVLIRILGFAHHRNLSLGPATLVKQAYNETRPFRHGKAF